MQKRVVPSSRQSPWSAAACRLWGEVLNRLEKDPESGSVFNIVGYAYLGMERYEKALACFDRYIELEPENSNAYDSRSECLFRMG